MEYKYETGDVIANDRGIHYLIENVENGYYALLTLGTDDRTLATSRIVDSYDWIRKVI